MDWKLLAYGDNGTVLSRSKNWAKIKALRLSSAMFSKGEKSPLDTKEALISTENHFLFALSSAVFSIWLVDISSSINSISFAFRNKNMGGRLKDSAKNPS